jgi:uncharacterized glyoxalase superfamily protein PhnB
MADDSQTTFEGLAAIFQVRDFAEALAWYRDVLGFEVGWTVGDPPSYASVCRDRAEINFGAPKPGQTIAPSSVYIAVTDIDAYHDALRARGATIDVPIADRDYGMRDFTVTDPSGNRISYGMAIRG